MKKLIVLILMAATFLGGYHLGRQPNSPDVIGQLQAAWDQAVKLGGEVAAMVDGKKSTLTGNDISAAVPVPESMTVTVDGKAYQISSRTPAEQSGR
jgi:hypothetical protein